MFRWSKRGHLFAPKGDKGWMHRYAQVPFTLIRENSLRIFFSTRNAPDEDYNFISNSGFIDVDKADFRNILRVASEPILKLGEKGSFDEFGIMAGSIVQHGADHFLYYCGWTRMKSVPYNWAIGLAVSNDGGETFRKIGPGPILGPTLNEPYLQACPIVFKVDQGWHMYYLSGQEWITAPDGKMESIYVLMHATSSDGIHWIRNGRPILETAVEDECQTSASIFERDGKFHLFFSYRHGLGFRDNPERGYRIGYAHSVDLETWTRRDDVVGIETSPEGWDSEMVAYPHVFEIDGATFMLYCGNYFGRTGFGYACLE